MHCGSTRGSLKTYAVPAECLWSTCVSAPIVVPVEAWDMAVLVPVEVWDEGVFVPVEVCEIILVYNFTIYIYIYIYMQQMWA